MPCPMSLNNWFLFTFFILYFFKIIFIFSYSSAFFPLQLSMSGHRRWKRCANQNLLHLQWLPESKNLTQSSRISSMLWDVHITSELVHQIRTATEVNWQRSRCSLLFGSHRRGNLCASQKRKSTLQLLDLSSSTKSIRNKQMLKDVQASTKLLYWFLTHSGLKPQEVMGRTKMKPSQAACCAAMHDTFPIKTCNNLKLTDFLNVCCLSLLLGVSAVFYHLRM